MRDKRVEKDRVHVCDRRERERGGESACVRKRVRERERSHGIEI